MNKREKWQWVVLISSVLQLISPGIFTLLGYSVSAKQSDPQITPAGYTFIVWGLITLLSFCYGVYQFIPGRKNKELHFTVSKALTIVYLLFVCWLFAATTQWLITTVIIFIIMFILLTLVFEKIIENRQRLTWTEQFFLFAQVAIYTGWTTVAIFANTASVVKFYGLPDYGFMGILWQSLLLIFALMNSKYWLKKFNYNIVYGGTILWALFGVLIGLMQFDNNLPLKIIAFLGIVLVVIHLVNFKTHKFFRIKGSS